jgi:hypothetical protein
MSFTRSGIPLWIYYQQKTPIANLSDVIEGNLYFMIEDGSQCESVFIIKKNVAINTITIQTLGERKVKELDLNLFQSKKLKFYENEIDP